FGPSPPVGALAEPVAGAGDAGDAGAVLVVLGSEAVVSDGVEALAAGSVTVPLSVLETLAIRVLASVVPVSASPATPPPSSPAVRPYTARRRGFMVVLVLSGDGIVTRSIGQHAPPRLGRSLEFPLNASAQPGLRRPSRRWSWSCPEHVARSVSAITFPEQGVPPGRTVCGQSAESARRSG